MKNLIVVLCIIGLFSPFTFVSHSKKVTKKESLVSITKNESNLTKPFDQKPWVNTADFQRPKDNFFFGKTEMTGWQTWEFNKDSVRLTPH